MTPLKVPYSLTPEMYDRYQEGESLEAVGRLYGISGTAVSRRFRRAGLAIRPPSISPAKLIDRVAIGEGQAARRDSYGREYIAECIALAAEELGRVPSGEEYRAFAQEWSLPSRPRVTQLFENWAAALAAAGLESPRRPRPIPRRFTPEKCVEAVRACAREVGRPPTSREYQAWAKGHRTAHGGPGPYPSATLVTTRCGDGTRWTSVLTRAFPEEMKENL